MEFPEHMRNHIKKLYIVYSKELSTAKVFNNTKSARLKQFITILKIYYPWANKQDLKSMTDIVDADDTKLEDTVWLNNITQQYKQNIIELFGIIDKDKSCTIDIDEFKVIFASCTTIDYKQIESLFNDADVDQNGILDIIEFINFVAKHDELRQQFDTVINSAVKKKKKSNYDRLAIIFKNLPDSPQRTHWRPSLCDVKSPSKIQKYLDSKSKRFSF